MERTTAEILLRVTSDFYRAVAGEFSRTRGGAWAGWGRVLDEAGIADPASQAPLSVLDVGCGNLRFERWLRAQLPTSQLECFAVDDCEQLLPGEEELANDFPYVRFQKLDVLGRLVHGSDLVQALEAPPCHLVACFGLAHHVPGAAVRQALLEQLVACAQPGGHVAVTFWQFMDSSDLAQAAEQTTERALADLRLARTALDEGDYLLGWQNQPGVYRYCHHTTVAEIDALIAALPGYVREVARFACDGRTGALNTYVVLAVD